jgi:hypothetical protein
VAARVGEGKISHVSVRELIFIEEKFTVGFGRLLRREAKRFA